MSSSARRNWLAGGVVAVWVASVAAVSACTAILGVSDLPPATNGSDGGLVDAAHTDGSRDGSRKDGSAKDATSVDAPASRDGRAGDATDAAATPFAVVPGTLAFGTAGGRAGFVACGTTPSAETFTVTNNTSGNLSWWTAFGLGASSPYAVSPQCTMTSPCTLSPHDAKMVTVTPPSVPLGAGMTSYDDSVTVFSSVPGDEGHFIALEEASYGAVLAFSPADVNFGQQPANQPDGGYREIVQIENTGNAAYDGTLTVGPSAHGDAGSGDGGADGGDAAVDSGSNELTMSMTSIDVPPTAGLQVTATFSPDGVVSAVSGLVTIGPSSAPGTCAPLPQPLTMEAQGTNSPISVTSSLNFNQGQNGNVGVSCGSAAGTLDVVVTNRGATSAQVTALSLGLGASSPFVLPSPSGLPITVPPASDAGPTAISIPVTSVTIPGSTAAGTEFADTLTVKTNAVGDLPHTVAINMTAAGVVLSLSVSDIVFSSTRTGGVGRFNLFLTNSGNIPSNGPVFSANPSVFASSGIPGVGPYSTAVFNANFQPMMSNTYLGTGSIVVAPGTPTCAGFTGTVPITFKGTGLSTAVDQLQPNDQLNMGNAQCAPLGGTGVTRSPAPVQLINGDSVVVNWTASLTGPGAPFFNLSTIGGAIPVMQKADITVTFPALTSTSGLSALQAAYGLYAMLTVTAVGGDTEVFSIPVFGMPEGAYPTWPTSELRVSKGGVTPFQLWNASMQSADFILTSGAPSFAVKVLNGPASRENQPLNASVTDRDAGLDAGTTITASLANANSPLCGPLPAPLPVTVSP